MSKLSTSDTVAGTSLLSLTTTLSDSPLLSIKDKQLPATLYLKECSSRIDDIEVELSRLHLLFSDINTALNRDKKNSNCFVKESNYPILIQVIKVVKSIINNTGSYWWYKLCS